VLSSKCCTTELEPMASSDRKVSEVTLPQKLNVLLATTVHGRRGWRFG